MPRKRKLLTEEPVPPNDPQDADLDRVGRFLRMSVLWEPDLAIHGVRASFRAQLVKWRVALARLCNDFVIVHAIGGPCGLHSDGYESAVRR